MTENKAITHTKSESGKNHAIHTHLTIEYRIEEFEPMMEFYEPGKSLESEGVSSELAPQAEWKLKLYPNGWKEEHKGNVVALLNLTGPMEDNKETLDATYRICIVDASGSKIDVAERETKNFKAGDGWGWGCCIDHERVKKALHADGSLLVVAEVEFLPPCDDKVTAAMKGDLISKWHDYIGKLLKTGAHSDCTLMVGGEELKAHRLVLSAISPVFEQMFGNEAYQEAKDGIVRIEDFTAKAVRAMLDFAYKGCIDWARYSECKRDVLILACKYLIDALKHHVETLLINEIDTESFAGLALLADKYSCEILKKACILYLSSNVQAVVLAPQREVLANMETELLELLRLVRESKAAADEGGTE